MSINRKSIEDGFVYLPKPPTEQTAAKGKGALEKGKSTSKKQTLTGAPLSHKQALEMAVNPGKGSKIAKPGKSKKSQ